MIPNVHSFLFISEKPKEIVLIHGKQMVHNLMGPDCNIAFLEWVILKCQEHSYLLLHLPALIIFS